VLCVSQRKVVTRSSAVRKQKSASRWKPVDDMIANQYYAGHYCGDIEDEVSLLAALPCETVAFRLSDRILVLDARAA